MATTEQLQAVYDQTGVCLEQLQYLVQLLEAADTSHERMDECIATLQAAQQNVQYEIENAPSDPAGPGDFPDPSEDPATA